jgi:hypothetical protein
MSNIDKEYCLRMARSLDAKAASKRDDSYLRKLLQDQAMKYRTDAGKRAATGGSGVNRESRFLRTFRSGCYFFRVDTGATE